MLNWIAAILGIALLGAAASAAGYQLRHDPHGDDCEHTPS